MINIDNAEFDPTQESSRTLWFTRLGTFATAVGPNQRIIDDTQEMAQGLATKVPETVKSIGVLSYTDVGRLPTLMIDIELIGPEDDAQPVRETAVELLLQAARTITTEGGVAIPMDFSKGTLVSKQQFESDKLVTPGLTTHDNKYTDRGMRAEFDRQVIIGQRSDLHSEPLAA